MKTIYNIISRTAVVLLLAVVAVSVLESCSSHKSYAELLDEETKAINAYLADQRVIGDVPADGKFEIGPDAPYYRMDKDGLVYMRVVSNPNPDNMAKYNDLVYFRFMRYDLYDYKDGELPSGSGNAENISNTAQFRFDNYNSVQSGSWGEGIQTPLKYLGYGCEVEMVIRSQSGRNDEIANVVPFMYAIRYYKSNN